jgi:restriction system protein
MVKFPDPEKISADEFEKLVKSWFESCSTGLTSFEAHHRDKLSGMDGEYEIDVSLRFKLFGGAEILALVECKRHTHPIDRFYVQVLKDRKESLGAHKAFLVSTSSFKSGAITYASKNGIALIQIVDGSVMYIQDSLTDRFEIPKDAEKLVGLFYGENPDGELAFPIAVSARKVYILDDYLEKDIT